MHIDGLRVDGGKPRAQQGKTQQQYEFDQLQQPASPAIMNNLV